MQVWLPSRWLAATPWQASQRAQGASICPTRVTFSYCSGCPADYQGKERKERKERKGKERKGRKGKERKERKKERKGKERIYTGYLVYLQATVRIGIAMSLCRIGAAAAQKRFVPSPALVLCA
jgi:hypothetical protein